MNRLIFVFIFILTSCGLKFGGNSNSSAVGAGIASGASLIFDANTLTGTPSPGGSCTNSTWNDSSGSGKTGTIFCAAGGGYAGSGIPTDPFRMEFNGGSTSVTTLLNAQPNIMPSSTWVAWVKPATINFQQIFSIDDNSGGFNRALVVDFQSGHFGVYNPFNSIWVTQPVDLGVWQFVAITFDSNDLIFTKNGTFLNLGTLPNYQPTIQTFTIGRSAAGLFDFYNGSIAWLAVYPRALKPVEIKNTCRALLPRFGSATCN